MSAENKVLLQKLNDKIQTLSKLIENHKHIKTNEPCFDVQLFNQQKTQISYQTYLLEIENNYQKLTKLINKESTHHYLEHIHYLAELIVNQINALQREVATLSLRKKTPTPKYETVFEKYNRNLDYLRRLEAMKYELKQTNQVDQSTKQKLEVLEQRISRCKQAITLLEQKAFESN